MQKKIILILFFSVLFLGGCTKKTQQENSTQYQEEKTTQSGLLKKVGSQFLLQMGSKTEVIDSYNVDLSIYANQQVTITGQYSGDTLFADQVIVNK